MTRRLCAGSLVFQAPLVPIAARLMAKELDRYGWMTWHAWEASHILTSAGIVGGEKVIVLTAKTPVSSAPVASLK